MLFSAIRQLHQDFRASVAKRIRTQEIVKVLSSSHMQELAETPGEQWAMVKARHSEQIQAVRDGKWDIVDRRSWAWPYIPEALHRLNQPILKNTPYNLRRFSDTPIPRRAINLIKNAILALDWQIEPVPEMENEGNEQERQKRIQIATDALRRPNNVDSYRTFMEAVLEDIIIGGYGCFEPRMTPYYQRPFKLWPVDGSTIRIYADWTEGTPDRPRFAQMTGLKGERGVVAFLADELVYIKDNVKSSTPFGLGKLECAFNTVNAFLSAQDMAGRAGADQVHKTMLWWEQPQNQAHIQTVRRHLQNELEGQAKISLVAGLKQPQVMDLKAVQPDDLLLEWQEFLIRIIANAFDISPFSLGLEKDVNRNTGLIMALSDFRGAVVPMATRVQEAITRNLLHGFMGWKDLQFAYSGLEDPDPLTKVQIQQRQYMMNAITPDEIREDNGDAPLAAGWGKLTQGQMMILQAEAMALAKTAGGGAQGGAGGAGGQGSAGNQLPPGAGSWGSSGTTATMGRMGSISDSAGSMGIGAGQFDPDEIANMTPEHIQYFQENGLLPPTPELADQMDIQAPGILEQLNDQLKEFFQDQEAEEQQDQKKKPQKITPADERSQVERFQDSMRTPTVMEQYLNERYASGSRTGGFDPFTNAERQPKVRGKYPRSGGRSGRYK